MSSPKSTLNARVMPAHVALLDRYVVSLRAARNAGAILSGSETGILTQYDCIVREAYADMQAEQVLVEAKREALLVIAEADARTESIAFWAAANATYGASDDI